MTLGPPADSLLFLRQLLKIMSFKYLLWLEAFKRHLVLIDNLFDKLCLAQHTLMAIFL